MNNTNKGFSTLATIGMVVLVLIIVGSFYYASNSTNLVDKESISLNENKENVVVNDEDNTIIDIDSEMTEDKISDLFYSGKVLAGNSSKLIDFNKSDYEKAIASDKVVILYFYASWCPICQAEFPKMQQAFDSLSTDKVVGFRVNYNDSDTDDYEKNLARQFGVPYQHTKIFIKNGERVLKSPESWNKDKYIEEINKFIN
ncbi:MAG: hypothetical protein A2725_04020 [Candidatus Magasanikbacteria bacterium RIFCSPHIGHO2_01_FULL_33_34]|uniref:Thioredoxin domain-containing protein n=1 Tax=Candidatus Magasanikbacteria bacterium RIFCSPHIGHO2_01_FULL_33_34 TaxID=1798671 RepID=A0A1F6LHL1_9BACT|nr:MAG: hypothetical protein A2725_04020 [Candidatus Magasanikbacteria bacterium RIFCSPHIGHO2_01_FULL_33_34]OGH65135.1 MAG: hypothetical protein A3B83_03780 [Candidatus Magasanikbacteria bacterium RIFCSPHIGHO2_02_FULL_33_17]OGH75321.1 MAG: hypothetical protein A3A89_04385 [Candidatus Magasanikbacteria bacterium RIFCSPLOWO2_01_FULL_33_34]OGH81702.1 MAG: hypothetical protein A3F93_03055 [Candidatus Magasanikbacteria bacterium RIFCSPLOWO2_12_FULL_34_7]